MNVTVDVQGQKLRVLQNKNPLSKAKTVPYSASFCAGRSSQTEN